MPYRLDPGAEARDSVRAALRLGLIYVGIALCLALVSNWAINRWIGDPQLRSLVQAVSEPFFIVGTGALLVYLAHRELERAAAFEQHYRTVVEQSLAGLTVVQDQRFLFVNQRYAEMFGYEPEEMVGRPVAEVIAPEDRETVIENLRQRLEGEIDDIHYRYTGATKDDERIRVEVYGRRIDWKGEPVVTSIHLDVTEEESLREQARRSQRMEALGELTGSVAHDFNNILTTIIAPLEICEEELGQEHPIRRELEEAKDNAKRAVTLTRQLLAFSRRRIYRPRPIDLGELVERTAPMLRRLTSSGVELHLEIAEKRPTVEVDSAHFEQVLLNLVTNAADAVEGQGDVWIRVRPGGPTRDRIPDLVLEVEDTGRGMDEETRHQIFEPFFTTRETGTGLGLSTVHGIVKQADGEITVDSQLGVGTTFRLRIPGVDEESEPLVQHEERERTKNGVLMDGASILVVDDEDAVRRVTTRVLERHGMAVQSASTAKDAIEAIEERASGYNILLTDVGLPDMDGVELAGRIRKLDSDISVLYMSGHSDEEVLGRLARDRSSGFVEKPFSVDELLEAVRVASDGGDSRSAEAS